MIKKIFISGFDAQAITLFNEDDDYFMAAATCYMRLNKYDEALRMLQTVIDRSPNNFKALYHYAFCQRASGSQKNAIEGLTKVSLRCCDYIYWYLWNLLSFCFLLLLDSCFQRISRRRVHRG